MSDMNEVLVHFVWMTSAEGIEWLFAVEIRFRAKCASKWTLEMRMMFPGREDTSNKHNEWKVESLSLGSSAPHFVNFSILLSHKCVFNIQVSTNMRFNNNTDVTWNSWRTLKKQFQEFLESINATFQTDYLISLKLDVTLCKRYENF